jgi:hypothetical protein
MLWLATFVGCSSCSDSQGISRRAETPPAQSSKQIKRPPDITGVITLIDTLGDQDVWVEADSSNRNVNPREPSKVRVSNLLPLTAPAKVSIGCVVRVWFDFSMPVADTDPQLVAGDSVEIVRCNPSGR